MTNTISQVLAEATQRGNGVTEALSRKTTGALSARSDALSEALSLYSDSKGQRPYGLNPLDGYKPDPNAFAPGNPPLTGQRAFTLFDALQSVTALFQGEAALGRGSMNMMTAVSRLMSGMVEQQKSYQDAITTLNETIKADQPSLVSRIFEDIFMVGLGSLLAFSIGGPAAGMMALGVGGLMDFLSQAKIFGSGDDKKSFFGALLDDLPIGEQIGIKVAISAALAAMIGAGALASLGTETVAVGAEELGDIEMDDLAGEAADNPEETREVYSPNTKMRAVGLTVINFFQVSNEILSTLNIKDKNGNKDTTEFGLLGDVFKAIPGTSDSLANWLATGIELAVSLIGTGAMGHYLGVVPNFESGATQKILAVLQSGMAVGQGGTQIYSGVQDGRIAGVLDTEAFVTYELGKLKQKLQGTEFTQSIAQTVLQRDTSSAKNSMNTIWGILDAIQTASGFNQAV